MISNTTKRIVSFSFILLLASLSGCTMQGPGNGNTNDNGNDNDNGSQGVACVTGAEATVECTPETCTTSIAADVPSFFLNYFRCVTITLDGNDVVITSNGTPPHKSFYYSYGTPSNESHPNFTAFDTSDGRFANPNVISNNALTVRFPMNPTSTGLTIDGSLVDAVNGSSSAEFTNGPAGIALDGVAMFNSLAAPGDDIDDEVFTFDGYEAHAEMTGDYHYHSATPGPLEILEAQGILSAGDTTPGSAAIELYGIMCDGTVVMGCTELDGSTPSDGDFDSQNGHTHDLVDADGTTQLANRYHVHICADRYTAHRYNPEIQFYEDCTVE